MWAACASPSDGACTIGTPIYPSKAFASSTMLLLRRDEAWACTKASSSSPAATASCQRCMASSRVLCLASSVCALKLGGWPSNTNTGLMPASIRLVVRYKKPDRCDVTSPLEFLRGVPSLCRMMLKNWYRVL